jgi:hypothetical protein
MNEETSFNTTSNRSSLSAAQYTALMIRLDTKPIIEDIELFLKGEVITIKQDGNGNVTTENRLIAGARKMNDKGISTILNKVQAMINTQTVQGNFDDIEFEDYVIRVHQELACTIMLNMHEWEISEGDYEEICDFVMNLVEPFISRLKDNKERESYADTIKHFESHSEGQKSWKDSIHL